MTTCNKREGQRQVLPPATLWQDVLDLRLLLEQDRDAARNQKQRAEAEQDWKLAAYWDGYLHQNQLALDRIANVVRQQIERVLTV